MGQGRENARVFLREHKDIRDKLENALRKKMEIPAPKDSANGTAGPHGPNGHAAPTQSEKPPMKAAAAAASSSESGKGRPSR